MMRLTVLLGLIVIVLTPGSCFGVPFRGLTFTIPDQHTGTISFAGGAAAPLIGRHIRVDSIVYAEGLSAVCVSCVLDFSSTGVLINRTPRGEAQWDATGSTLAITGGVDFDGGGIGPGDIPVGTTLIRGGMYYYVVLRDDHAVGEAINSNALVSRVDPALVAAIGSRLGSVPPDGFWQGPLVLSVTLTHPLHIPGPGLQIGDANAFQSTRLGGQDFVLAAPTPEPGTLLLVVTAGAGLGTWAWRRKR